MRFLACCFGLVESESTLSVGRFEITIPNLWGWALLSRAIWFKWLGKGFTINLDDVAVLDLWTCIDEQNLTTF